MQAMILRDGALRVDTFPDPEPGPGLVLVRTLACGICASDIHLQQHGHNLAEWSRRTGGVFQFDPEQDMVMGHEICGEVLDHGPGTERRLPVGTRVTSAAVIPHAQGMAVMGHSNEYPGGFGELMVLSESMIQAIPDGLPNDAAALTEPLSIGFQYARIGNPQSSEVPLIIGCGAIGLSIIAALKQAGVSPIVASDFSPHRRQLAVRTGADEVVDPAQGSPFDVWKKTARGRKNPIALIFECVGVPGILNQLFDAAPVGARIVMAGFCMEEDGLFLAGAHSKGINIQLGGIPDPMDFSGALRALGDGQIDVSSWITGHAPLGDALRAFDDAKDASRHTRIVIQPCGQR